MFVSCKANTAANKTKKNAVYVNGVGLEIVICTRYRYFCKD